MEKEQTDGEAAGALLKAPQTYTPPQIQTFTGEEILEMIGPAQACSPAPCAVGG